MSQPGKWWLGLVPLLVLWLLANWLETAGVEHDIAARAGAAVASASTLESSHVDAAGRDVTVAGLVFTPAGADSGVAVARATPGVRLVTNAAMPPPTAQPFDWSVKRDGGSVLLSGHVSMPEARATILAAARSAFPGATVKDEMKYAGGAPDGFASAAVYGIAQAAALSNGSVTLSGGDYAIAGEAPTAAAYDAAMAGTRVLPAGLALAKAEILPPVLKPYVWRASSDGKTVILDGAVPSAELRAGLAAEVVHALPGLAVVDRLRIARGVPSGDFLAAAKLGLQQLAQLAGGKAVLDDNRLSISGTGKPGITADGVTGAIRSGLPQGFDLASVDIEAGAISPYTFNATKGDGVLTLTGYIPDDKTHRGILEAARRLFFGETVTDQLAIGAGAPDSFGDAVSAALGPLSRLAQGTLAMSGTEVKLSGQALYDKAAGDIQAAFAAALPAPFKPDATVTVKPPEPAVDAATCQGLFSAVLGKGTIGFDTGAATISPDSAGLLDTLVGVAERCPDARIEISGNTDSTGDAAANLDLSKRRADAVADYLKQAGVAPDHLATVGYGSTRPVASNDTEEGRARNRRIDFLVN
jgi:OOP family OmpA-OmpF porin